VLPSTHFAMTVAARPRPSKKWSIAAWGLVAAFAVVLSYVVSLCLALACLALPLLLFNSTIGGFGALLLAVFGVVVGITILWSLIPRRDKFEPPGVRIDLSEQRRLAQEVEAIAGALGEPMPAEVYLIPDVNAFVAQRGGFLGAGSRRVMGLGLPLMQVLTLSQFRAVLAHEFAHFYSGDTRLGPWVFKTRSAMARVINSLGQPSAFLRFLGRFGIVALAHTLVIEGLVAYWKLFMRVTQLISRRQEYRSDELACYIAGSDALIEGLQGVNKASAVLGPYWNSVVVPAVNIGYRPQLADGFGRFMNAPAISQAASDYLARQLASSRTDPLDTHPPLNARIAKARALGIVAERTDDQPSISLIDNLSNLEKALLGRMAPALANAELKPMEWETAGAEVYLPSWQKHVTEFLHLLTGITVASLPRLLKDPRDIAARIPDPPGMLLTREQRSERAATLLRCALTLALLDHGWKLQIQPGNFSLQRGDLLLEPPVVITKLQSGELSARSWATYCTNAGIDDWPLDQFSFLSFRATV
jgi:heat shock protein HtpX